jgi:hypothetical protein
MNIMRINSPHRLLLGLHKHEDILIKLVLSFNIKLRLKYLLLIFNKTFRPNALI